MKKLLRILSIVLFVASFGLSACSTSSRSYSGHKHKYKHCHAKATGRAFNLNKKTQHHVNKTYRKGTRKYSKK